MATVPAAGRAERAEAGFWAQFARNIATSEATRDTGALAVAGGYAIVLQGTYLEYGLAVGSTRPLRDDDLHLVDEFYGARNLPSRLELHPAVAARDAALLRDWGYVAEATLQILERDVRPSGGEPRDAGIEPMDHRKAAWTDVVTAAFADAVPADDRGRLRRATLACAAAASRLFAVRADGRLAGGGALAVTGDAALLFSGAVLPEYRRRGFHRALTKARLDAAATAGATFAFMKAAPDGAARRSAEAAGFEATYQRLRLRRVTKP